MSNEFYLVSDTHGYVNAYRSLNKMATIEKKAYILGDLFDHNYGDERELLNILVNMLNEDRAVFVMGNHDLGLFNILFPSNTYECKLNLLKYSNNIILKVLEGLYSQRIYKLVKMYIEEFRKTQNIDKYIDNVSYAIGDSKFNKINSNLQYLYKDCKQFINLKIKNIHILLTHSGDPEDIYSNQIITSDFNPNIKYDLGFMGHITTSHLKQNLSQIQNPLQINNFIINKHRLANIDIKGSYYYNIEYKVFMIDNGTHNNIVEVKIN